MSLIVVGSANMDLVVRCDEFPIAGETVLGSGFQTFPGGKGANQAVAAGLMGGPVAFVGMVGNDSFGKEMRASLEAAGVDTSHLFVHPSLPSGVGAVRVNAKGQNSIVVVLGANDALDRATVQNALREMNPKVVLVQLESPLDTVEAVLELRCTRILNPAPARLLPDTFYHQLDWITPNESEVETLTGLDAHGDTRAAAHVLLDKGVRNVIITLGARGCYWTDGAHEQYFPTIDVPVVDTTAAGDAFSGVFAQQLASGTGPERAIQTALVAASLSVSREGAQASMPTREEVEQTMEKTYGQIH